MRTFLMFLLISAVVILAGDYYFEYVVGRDIFPPTLVAVFTGLFIVVVVCYIIYLVKMLQRVLKINQQPKEEEQQ